MACKIVFQIELDIQFEYLKMDLEANQKKVLIFQDIILKFFYEMLILK